MRESVLNQFNQQPAEESADVKLLKRMNELKERKKEIEKAISETDDFDKRAILEFDLEDIERQISRCPDSIGAYNKKRKISRIEKIAGEQKDAINPEFLAGLEKFKTSRGDRPQPRA